MIKLHQWTTIALVFVLSVTFTSQQPILPTSSTKPVPPPANSSNGTEEAELKFRFFINRWFPSFASSSVPQPLKQSEQHETQLPMAPGKVITSPAFPVVTQPRPAVLFQTPEPFSPSTGFQGHAAYFQKVRQKEMQKQRLVEQYLYAQRLHAFQQQQAELQQMIQAKQFLQQMHPTVRQWFQQMSPLAQFNMFQQYLKYQKLIQEQVTKNQINSQRKEIYLPQARIGQYHPEQPSTTGIPPS